MDAPRQFVICRICGRLIACVALWNRLSILCDQTDAQSLCRTGAHCGGQIRYSFHSHLRDRSLRLDGLDLLHPFSQSASSSHTTWLLVHDANWDDSWILHVLPNESLAH